MLGEKVFFSFTHITDPITHAAYNEWHQLDHRPENLALDGVVHGERWVHSPDCSAFSRISAELPSELHYVNMYWFRNPVQESFAAWQELAERTFQLGRRPDVSLSTRLAMGTFLPVKGYVHPRVQVSPDALALRPNRGVEITVTRVRDPQSPVAERYFRWQDRIGIPAVLECEGVAGVWTFSSDSTTLDAGRSTTDGVTFTEDGQSASGQIRIVVAFLDQDPIRCLADTRRLANSVPAVPSTDVEDVLFTGILRSIEPWNWSWFDA